MEAIEQHVIALINLIPSENALCLLIQQQKYAKHINGNEQLLSCIMSNSHCRSQTLQVLLRQKWLLEQKNTNTIQPEILQAIVNHSYFTNEHLQILLASPSPNTRRLASPSPNTRRLASLSPNTQLASSYDDQITPELLETIVRNKNIGDITFTTLLTDSKYTRKINATILQVIAQRTKSYLILEQLLTQYSEKITPEILEAIANNSSSNNQVFLKLLELLEQKTDKITKTTLEKIITNSTFNTLLTDSKYTRKINATILQVIAQRTKSYLILEQLLTQYSEKITPEILEAIANNSSSNNQVFLKLLELLEQKPDKITKTILEKIITNLPYFLNDTTSNILLKILLNDKYKDHIDKKILLNIARIAGNQHINDKILQELLSEKYISMMSCDEKIQYLTDIIHYHVTNTHVIKQAWKLAKASNIGDIIISTILRYLAANPRLIEVLSELLAHNHDKTTILNYIAGNVHANTQILKELLNEYTDYITTDILKSIARNKHINAEILEQLLSERYKDKIDTELLSIIVSNVHANATILKKLLGEESYTSYIDTAILSNIAKKVENVVYADPEILKLLLSERYRCYINTEILSNIARNLYADTAILKELLNERYKDHINTEILSNIARSRYADTAILKELLNERYKDHINAEILSNIARRCYTDTAIAILKELLNERYKDHINAEILSNIASNYYADLEILKLLLNERYKEHINKNILKSIIRNKNINVEILQECLSEKYTNIMSLDERKKCLRDLLVSQSPNERKKYLMIIDPFYTKMLLEETCNDILSIFDKVGLMSEQLKKTKEEVRAKINATEDLNRVMLIKDVFKILQDCSLLTHDPQATFDTLLTLDDSRLLYPSKYMGLKVLVSLGLFSENEGPSNLKAVITSPYMEDIIIILSKLKNLNLISNSNVRSIFRKIIKLKDNIPKLREAIITIEQFNLTHVLTSTSINNLLESGENSASLARLLIAVNNMSLDDVNADIEAFTKIINDITLEAKTAFNALNKIYKIKVLQIYGLFIDKLDFKILNAICCLPENQIDILYNLLDCANPSVLLSDSEALKASLPVMAIHMLFTIDKLYKELPKSDLPNLPIAGDRESSMRDKLVISAKKRFDTLKEQYCEKLNSTGLENVEAQIRKQLLETIRTNAVAEIERLREKLSQIKKEEHQSAQLSLTTKSWEILQSLEKQEKILEILTNDNIELISSQNNSSLLAQSRELFTSNTDLAQIAWRAYDAGSRTVEWSNLLTVPNDDAAQRRVFTTRESTVGMDNDEPITLASTSLYARRYAALCFLASQDEKISPITQQEIWQDFVSYIAEIRRAHNNNATGIDNPSCFPGTISRISQSVNKHPDFCEETTEGIEQAIRDAVRAYINNQLSNTLDQLPSSAEKQQLYFSLMMLGLHNAKEVIENPLSILSILPDDEDQDLNPETVIQKYIQTRANFFAKLTTSPDNVLTKYVKEYLEQHKIPETREVYINYLINLTIANLPLLGIGVPQRHQDDVMMLTEEQPTVPPVEEQNFNSLPFPRQPINPSAKGNPSEIVEYWIPLFQSYEYNALMPVIKNHALCTKIIEERFGIEGLRSMSIEDIQHKLSSRNNYEVLKTLQADNDLPKYISDNMDEYNNHITAALRNVTYTDTEQAIVINRHNTMKP